ncbi:MAG TPA: hypothetical protein VGW40_16125 [Allosphingosinicella sp.]|nr:hypothetical protein [Allosphingosinicella sp.]
MRKALAILPMLAAGCAPAAGIGHFPASEQAQLRLRDGEDVAAMRRHAWRVLADVTRPGRDGAPAWLGWAPIARTFGGAGASPARPFRRIDIAETPGIALLQASGAPLLSLVLFNDPAYRHIRGERLYSRARLDAINAGFGAAAPLAARTIAPFPREAMAVKTVWAVVHPDRPTPISVWDGAGDAPDGNRPARWPRTVLVGPGATPLDHFFHLPIAADELATVRAIDPEARPGDHLVLLAMHLTTREIPDWIWTTYWWHDRPDVGPFAADRPPAVAGAWRHYLMDVAYSAATPPEADGTANIAFNPYLETFAAGTRSNCMACHQGAVWAPGGAAPFLPVTRGPRAPGDPRFARGTRLDFMWSIATEAR